MQSFNVLRDIHKGVPAVVMGSGPSLPEHLKSMPKGAIKISVNEKPLGLIECDYVVFFDHVTGGWLNGSKAKVIAPFKEYSDFIIEDHVWFEKRSATTACYLACFMGCDPVILMGMDCHKVDEKRYFDDMPDTVHERRITEYTGMISKNIWYEAEKNCPNPEVIRSMAKPLNEIFEVYNESC